MVSAIAQMGRWHFDVPFHGEAHGQEGIHVPLDNWHFLPFRMWLDTLSTKRPPIERTRSTSPHDRR
jgi:hypothetical protein